MQAGFAASASRAVATGRNLSGSRSIACSFAIRSADSARADAFIAEWREKHPHITLMREAAAQLALDGTAVVLCSAEVDDLAAVCDRVHILENGLVVRTLKQPMTPQDILSATYAQSKGKNA